MPFVTFYLMATVFSYTSSKLFQLLLKDDDNEAAWLLSCLVCALFYRSLFVLVWQRERAVANPTWRRINEETKAHVTALPDAAGEKDGQKYRAPTFEKEAVKKIRLLCEKVHIMFFFFFFLFWRAKVDLFSLGVKLWVQKQWVIIITPQVRENVKLFF